MFKILATTLDKFVIWSAARALRGKQGKVSANHHKAQALLDSPEFLLRPGVPEMQWKGERDFEFTSTIKTDLPNMDLVRGKFFRAGNDWKKNATVVMVHGWNDEFGYIYRFPWLAKMLLKHGINSMFLELPFHLKRRPKGEGIPRDFISADLFSTVRASQQSLADIRSAIAWLEKETTGRIGLFGVSLGGFLGGILFLTEERLHCGALMIPVCDLERAFCELDFCRPIRESLRTGTLNFEKIQLQNKLPLLPRDKILLIESEYDVFAPKPTIESLWAGWGEPQIWREKHGHISILFSRRIMERTVQWLSASLSD